MVVSFDDQIYVDAEMTDNRDEWRRAIRGTRVGRGARVFDAIDLTITERLSRLEGRKAIVLLTDGVDLASLHATARSTIARAEAPVSSSTRFNISLGSRRGPSSIPICGDATAAKM
jgi:hypothetical protein